MCGLRLKERRDKAGPVVARKESNPSVLHQTDLQLDSDADHLHKLHIYYFGRKKITIISRSAHGAQQL